MLHEGNEVACDVILTITEGVSFVNAGYLVFEDLEKEFSTTL
jgi:hypothetical protein